MSFRHNRGRGYMTIISEASLIMAITTYSVFQLHIICMHRMQKISLDFTFTTTKARTREASELRLKEIIEIAIQILPPEVDFKELDTQGWRWHLAKIIPPRG